MNDFTRTLHLHTTGDPLPDPAPGAGPEGAFLLGDATLYTGDCLDILKKLPEESVHCVVTSPPYFGLRDYGTDGQIGLEQTPDDYVAKLVQVFREVRRVLRDDGTVWLNLGDSYASGGRGGGMKGKRGEKQRSNYGALLGAKKPPAGFKHKDLLGIPWRVAFALQADGWWLRQDIIWHKPNPMPESVTDRCTKAHEYIFLLSKKAKYYYDAEAIKEPIIYGDHHRNGTEGYTYQAPGQAAQTGISQRRQRKPAGWDTGPGAHGAFHKQGRAPSVEYSENKATVRNKRSVWNISTAPYPDAHFATFPPKLVEPCIKAGTSEKGCCPECGAPWVRDVERGELGPDHSIKKMPRAVEADTRDIRDMGWSNKKGYAQNVIRPSVTVGWSPSCGCKPVLDGGSPVSCTVLDPFAGAGTVGLVADRLGRDAILIEAKAEYAEMARARIQDDAGMFAEVGAP